MHDQLPAPGIRNIQGARNEANSASQSRDTSTSPRGLPSLGKRKQWLSKAGFGDAINVQGEKQLSQPRPKGQTPAQARPEEQDQAVEKLEPLKQHEGSALQPLQVKAKTATLRRGQYVKNIRYYLDAASNAKSRLDRALALHSARARKRELLEDQERLQAVSLQSLPKEDQSHDAQKPGSSKNLHLSAHRSKEAATSSSNQGRARADLAHNEGHQPVSSSRSMDLGSSPFNPQKVSSGLGTKKTGPPDLTPHVRRKNVGRAHEPAKFHSLSTETKQAHSSTRPSYDHINPTLLPARGVGHISPTPSLLQPGILPSGAGNTQFPHGRDHGNAPHLRADPNYRRTGPSRQSSHQDRGRDRPISPEGLTQKDSQSVPSHSESNACRSRSASSSSLHLGDLENITPEQLFEGMKKSGEK